MPAATKPIPYRTRAAFLIANRWCWHTWTHSEGNKHAAIIDKSKAARIVEHILGRHEGTEPGRCGPRSKRDLFCRLCQVNLAARVPEDHT